MRAHRFLAAILGLALYALSPRSAAEVTTVNGATWLTGEIVPRDLLSLIERRREGLVVHLNTRGGHVTAAIAIGRLLRGMRATVRVDAGSLCLSACVFVLAGAPYRVVDPGATVGIHRPYDSNDPLLSPQDQEKKQAQLDAYVKAYLKEVNVPPSLYEAMLKAPGTRMLTPSELAWYGLSGNDRKVQDGDAPRPAPRP